MRIVVASVHRPFTPGVNDTRAALLCAALRALGHLVESVRIPFHAEPADGVVPQLLACRLLDLASSSGSTIDRLIALEFPATLIPHPHKIAWLDHPFTSAYDAWDGRHGPLFEQPGGEAAMEVIRRADAALLPESVRVLTTSRALAEQLLRDCAVEAEPLYAPPPAGPAADTYDDVIFAPGGTHDPLLAAAFAMTRHPVRLSADTPMATALAVLLRAGEGANQALAAMQAARPVIACGSEAAPELVQRDVTGLVCRPIAADLAAALDALWADRPRARTLGRAGLDRFGSLNLTWEAVAQCLLT